MWPFLEDEQRLLWAAVLEFDAVPTQDWQVEKVKLQGAWVRKEAERLVVPLLNGRSCHPGSSNGTTSHVGV